MGNMGPLMQRMAVIDMGSNSFRLVVFEYESDGLVEPDRRDPRAHPGQRRDGGVGRVAAKADETSRADGHRVRQLPARLGRRAGGGRGHQRHPRRLQPRRAAGRDLRPDGARGAGDQRRGGGLVRLPGDRQLHHDRRRVRHRHRRRQRADHAAPGPPAARGRVGPARGGAGQRGVPARRGRDARSRSRPCASTWRARCRSSSGCGGGEQAAAGRPGRHDPQPGRGRAEAAGGHRSGRPGLRADPRGAGRADRRAGLAARRQARFGARHQARPRRRDPGRRRGAGRGDGAGRLPRNRGHRGRPARGRAVRAHARGPGAAAAGRCPAQLGREPASTATTATTPTCSTWRSCRWRRSMRSARRACTTSAATSARCCGRRACCTTSAWPSTTTTTTATRTT